ncbi:uncharacterized protein ARMOST_02833 [Armillaria ostoyae]|uniref:Protein ARV n=1 Tax=Armillaria ostoyae TaxID=47428 RepID=A0A284QSS7_ARMOS|nr:uncharacterized protein ARMOST_02833 [Armillaria ostoyae]
MSLDANLHDVHTMDVSPAYRSNCHAFADPYIEHDDLTLLIDLILLKRGVYRHLLFNRGAKPRRATETSFKDGSDRRIAREKLQWLLILRLGGTLTFVDAFIRWSHLKPLDPAATWNTPKLSNFIDILDNNQVDREWIVRNVLGGMSAGFGLRVILDCHPVFTMLVILCGWVAKTAMAATVSKWVGGDDTSGEAWLAYSIP